MRHERGPKTAPERSARRTAWSLAAALVMSGCVASAVADPAPPAAPDPAAANDERTVVLQKDDALRFTVAVMVDGHGPYQFVIDTGADRSAISSEVAAALRLPAGEPLKVHSMSGATLVPSVRVDSLVIAPDVAIRDLTAPVFSGDDLGADGLLGIDSLQGHQVVIDFSKHTMAVRTAKKHERPTIDDDGAVIVVARSKFGQLILVDSSIGGTPLRVILDTGAQFAVGNLAMRKLAATNGHEGAVQRVEMLSVVGQQVPADYTPIARINLAGFVLLNTPVAFADAHPFEHFGLTRRPSMLLGMDMLRLFRRVTIDFANRKVSFVPPQGLARTGVSPGR